MITESFDNRSDAKINPRRKEHAPSVDACIMTFSYKIEEYVRNTYACTEIARLESVSASTPVWQIEQNGKRFAFFKNCVGSPAYVGMMESTLAELNTDKYILFGGCGCLNREIARGRIIVPTAAWRDEGTSYHYLPAADTVEMTNAPVVEAFMKENAIPCVTGKTWTTDAFYRETANNFEKRKADGCISVEMECAGAQAMCTFKSLQLYAFLSSGDLLDAPEWTMRQSAGQIVHTQHDPRLFEIALALAGTVSTL